MINQDNPPQNKKVLVKKTFSVANKTFNVSEAITLEKVQNEFAITSLTQKNNDFKSYNCLLTNAEAISLYHLEKIQKNGLEGKKEDTSMSTAEERQEAQKYIDELRADSKVIKFQQSMYYYEICDSFIIKHTDYSPFYYIMIRDGMIQILKSVLRSMNKQIFDSGIRRSLMMMHKALAPQFTKEVINRTLNDEGITLFLKAIFIGKCYKKQVFAIPITLTKKLFFWVPVTMLKISYRTIVPATTTHLYQKLAYVMYGLGDVYYKPDETTVQAVNRMEGQYDNATASKDTYTLTSAKENATIRKAIYRYISNTDLGGAIIDTTGRAVETITVDDAVEQKVYSVSSSSREKQSAENLRIIFSKLSFYPIIVNFLKGIYKDPTPAQIRNQLDDAKTSVQALILNLGKNANNFENLNTGEVYKTDRETNKLDFPSVVNKEMHKKLSNQANQCNEVLGKIYDELNLKDIPNIKYPIPGVKGIPFLGFFIEPESSSFITQAYDLGIPDPYMIDLARADVLETYADNIIEDFSKNLETLKRAIEKIEKLQKTRLEVIKAYFEDTVLYIKSRRYKRDIESYIEIYRSQVENAVIGKTYLIPSTGKILSDPKFSELSLLLDIINQKDLWLYFSTALESELKNDLSSDHEGKTLVDIIKKMGKTKKEIFAAFLPNFKKKTEINLEKQREVMQDEIENVINNYETDAEEDQENEEERIADVYQAEILAIPNLSSELKDQLGGDEAINYRHIFNYLKEICSLINQIHKAPTEEGFKSLDTYMISGSYNTESDKTKSKKEKDSQGKGDKDKEEETKGNEGGKKKPGNKSKGSSTKTGKKKPKFETGRDSGYELEDDIKEIKIAITELKITVMDFNIQKRTYTNFVDTILDQKSKTSYIDGWKATSDEIKRKIRDCVRKLAELITAYPDWIEEFEFHYEMRYLLTNTEVMKALREFIDYEDLRKQLRAVRDLTDGKQGITYSQLAEMDNVALHSIRGLKASVLDSLGGPFLDLDLYESKKELEILEEHLKSLTSA